jgi:LTXXQ motif family protein
MPLHVLIAGHASEATLKENHRMKAHISRYLLPALLAATIPATIVYAQTQSQPQPEPRQNRERPDRPRLSPDTLNRLQDGRLAMMRESFKLNESQLKLWAPVEQQLRARFAARQQARQDFEQRREQRRQQSGATERPSLADRLDRASKRMTERAQRMQAFTEAFKPFYASLSDEQKAVAGIVLRERGGMGGHGRRWAMERAPDGQPPR